MRNGFEDWEFFLRMFEAMPAGQIGIVEKPLIKYRTTPASANIKSMTKRLDIMRMMIENHFKLYQDHLIDALLGIEATSITRLGAWEEEIVHLTEEEMSLSQVAREFLENPSYGDGGIAAAVRIASLQHKEAKE